MRLLFSLLILLILLFNQLNCTRSQNSNENYDINKMIKKVGEIKDVFQNPSILIDETQVYIWDKFICKIYIYSKDDLRKITVIGKRGEGPGEFPIINFVSLNDRFIFVSSFNKLSCFSKDGKFIKETRLTTPFGSFLPIGKNFIGRMQIFKGNQGKKNKIFYALFDSNLTKIKEIFETEFIKEFYEVKNSKIKLLWFKDCYRGLVYKDRFYVGSTDRGFYFAIFDSNGNKLSEINKKFNRVKITDDYIETLFKKIQNSNAEGFKQFIQQREIIFPEYFPAYSNFGLCNEKLYVFKYPTHLTLNTGNTLEALILDLKGNLLKQTSLPASFWRGFENNEIYFFNGKLYFIEASEKGENLEIYEANLDL